MNDKIIAQIINNWQRQTEQINRLLNSLTNEQLKKDIASNKKSGVYILGHLIATNENILTLLGLGEKEYPELEDIVFIHQTSWGKKCLNRIYSKKCIK